MNVANFLVRAAQIYGDRPAVAVGQRVLMDYKGLAARVSALAALLASAGASRHSRVVLFLENRAEYLESLLATWWVGACAVPLNTKLHPNELAYILSHSGATVCILSRKSAVVAAPAFAIAQTGCIDVVVDDPQWVAPRFAPLGRPAEVSPTDPGWVFYTSGTTGKPKGAVISHSALRFLSMNFRSDFDAITPRDNLLHVAPMSHGSGLCILPYLMGGACNVVPESGGFDPAEAHELLRHYTNVCFFAVPTMVHRLTLSAAGSPPENLKTLVYGGGPMHMATITAALDRFGPRFAQIYAQGETPMTLAVLPKWAHADKDHPDYLTRLGSVGIPCNGADVRVVDEKGVELPTGEVGEVVVRGPTVMSGYLNDDAATQRAIIDGWLWTGDLGAFGKDGFLTLKDRSKDLIIAGGSNIYAREVEDVLLKHPGVDQAAVVAKSDLDWGEVPVAFVVAKQDGQLTAEALDRFCLEHLSRFKRPKFYKLVPALPLNGIGKVLKTELRANIADAPREYFDLVAESGSQKA
ncbi:AMP-binding protein [Ensifer sp. ENS04]|uniref:AMP-binding protein n=1 Tax=Ensifer sp. ENS04 TaxID=2769281 RepID=UPI00177D6480|nr:AMP-binding protein [Ensifer sp. ENS04]MBD9541482.1 AMP-binding protein [Ensifer sp. ENS04]